MSRQNQHSKNTNLPFQENAAEVWEVPEGVSCLKADSVHAHPKVEQVHKIILPDTVRRIDNGCFSALHNLEEVQFPACLDEVGQGIFQHCWNLRRAVLPEGTRRIDAAFFYGCGRLRSMKIPKSVEEIDRDALRTCEQLTDAEIADEMFSQYPRTVRLLAALTCIRNGSVQTDKTGRTLHPQTAAYIVSHRLGLLDIAISKNDTDAVYQMLQSPVFSDALNRADLQRLADRANREGCMEIMAMLLKELQNRGADEEKRFAW